MNKGDRIRSHDFHGRTDCYIEGTITEITNEERWDAYKIIVDADCYKGKMVEGRIGKTFIVPVQTSNDYPNRIIKL